MSAIGLPLDEGGTVPTLFLEPHTELLVLFTAEANTDAPETAPPAESDPA